MSKTLLWLLLLFEVFGMGVGGVMANFHFYFENWLIGAVSIGAVLGLGWRFILHITMLFEIDLVKR
jgi:hypothetical protein